jgi:hypothetical protein
MVKLSLCLTNEALCWEDFWGNGYIDPFFFFLTMALVGVKWSASRPGHFIHRERAPGTYWIGGWMGPRAGLDTA